MASFIVCGGGDFADLVGMRGTIYTITPNPALDIGGTVDQLIANEKNYVSEETRSAGGNGINAARIARRLGAKVMASGFLGGSVGDEIETLLEKENIPHHFIRISGNTRINLTTSNAKTNCQTRLSFPGPKISRGELKRLINFVNRINKSSIVVIGGSLPKAVDSQHIANLVTKLRKKGVLCLVDMPGPELKNIISARPFFIKPNLNEFQHLIGKEVKSIQSILPFAQKLSEKIEMVCISSVEGGALLVTKSKAWFGRVPKVKVKSTVGAGDSMVGAISAVLLREKIQNKSAEDREIFFNEYGSDLLRWGLAAACATLVKPGIIMGDRNSISRYFQMIDIKEIPSGRMRRR